MAQWPALRKHLEAVGAPFGARFSDEDMAEMKTWRTNQTDMRACEALLLRLRDEYPGPQDTHDGGVMARRRVGQCGGERAHGGGPQRIHRSAHPRALPTREDVSEARVAAALLPGCRAAGLPEPEAAGSSSNYAHNYYSSPGPDDRADETNWGYAFNEERHSVAGRGAHVGTHSSRSAYG